MPIVRIARHGETTWNAVGRYQGRLETPLSPLGQAQAQALCGALRSKGIGRIVSSPLSRCIQTALPLSTVTGVPIEIEPLLVEIAHGTWEGQYRRDLAVNDPETYREWRRHPERVKFEGGESLDEVRQRWTQFVEAFVPDADTLLMTHDVIVRIALLERAGRPNAELRQVRALNGAYAQFAVQDGAWQLLDDCVDGHLTGLAADPERQAL